MNIQFDKTVLHNGTIIPGRKIQNNQVVSDGAIIDLDTDTRGLKDVAQNLIDRGLVHETQAAATHTLALVNAAQEAYPLSAPSNEASAPVADSLKRNLAAQKEVAAQKVASVSGSQPQAPQAPAVQTNSSPAPAPVAAGQPSPEEVAAAAAEA